jgi:hypothetical protein
MSALWLVLCLSGGLLIMGCACPKTVEQDYGRSVTNNLAQQVLNPEAGLDTTPAVGLTPTSGTNLYGAYEKTFKAEERKELLQMITTK